MKQPLTCFLNLLCNFPFLQQVGDMFLKSNVVIWFKCKIMLFWSESWAFLWCALWYVCVCVRAFILEQECKLLPVWADVRDGFARTAAKSQLSFQSPWPRDKWPPAANITLFYVITGLTLLLQINLYGRDEVHTNLTCTLQKICTINVCFEKFYRGVWFFR